MYEKYKSVLDSARNRYIIIGGIGLLICLCLGYIFCWPNGSDYQRTINAVERAQEQQRKSLELNRDIRSSIDRSSKLSHEAKGGIERSTQYNHEIGERITNSQGRLSEARSYLERNAELFRRIEEQSRERQENYQTTTDAAQPISDGGSGSSNRSSDSSIER